MTLQWVVGHYRIDLVVEGNGRRLAVECDGDKFHTIEKVAEDMARQAILERFSWRLVRIRGSQFFQNPDRAMRTVFEALEDVGIVPDAYEGEAASPSPAGDLVERIKRRAAAILQERDSSSTVGVGY